MRPQRSLKSRALQLLAQREQSKVELRRKLLAHARAEPQAAAEEAAEAGLDSPSASLAHAVGGDTEEPAQTSEPEDEVEAVLDWLEANQYLSAERFAESRVHAREQRFGNLRIRHELAQHQVTLSAEAAQALVDSELARARAVRERKFAAPPASAAERARQARFLGGRGFSADVIRRVLRDAARPDRSDDT